MTIFVSQSVEQTEAWAAELAQKLKPGDNLALCGELGGGKTAFVRGLCEGLGVTDEILVTSPTFTLLQEYNTSQGPVYHFDLYRLNNFNEFTDLDFESYLSGKGICVVEWADKFKEILEYFQYRVDFEIVGGDERKINLTSSTKSP